MHFPVRTSVLSLFLVVSLFSIPSAHAATVRGTVTDPDGGAASGARVLLRGPLGTVATTTAGADGTYLFQNVPDGPYEVRVVLEGFRAEAIAVNVAGDEDRDVPVTLAIGALSEEIVVTAAQMDMPLSHTPDSVTLITASDIRARQVQDLAGAMRLVPGLTVSQSGGHGALTSVFPRGGESDFTLVLVDGIRANSFGGGFDFGQMPIANVDRIEVVRGPQSALYGADAIGAVVQIVTRRGGAPFIEGVVEGGGFGTRRAAISSAGEKGPWEFGAGAELLTSDGFTGRAANGETVSNDDFETHQVTVSGGWRPASTTFFRGEARIGADERGFPGPYGSDPGGTYSGVDRISRGTNDQRLFSVSGAHAWNNRVSQRAQLTYADLEGQFVSPFGESDNESERWSGRVQTDIAVSEAISASVGIEAQRESAGSTFITGETFEPVPVRRRVIGYFAEARFLSAQRLFVTGGFRVEQIHRDALAGNPSTFDPRPAFAADDVLSPNPKLAVGWFVQPVAGRDRQWTRVHGSAGTGIRPPTAFEIAFTDNPNLRPERSRSFEAGVEQAFAGGAAIIDATAFNNSYDDLIVAVGQAVSDASRYRTDNISNARSRGLELSFAGRTRWGLDARMTYTWMDTEILELDGATGVAPDPFTVGQPLIRRPRHQGRVDIAFTRGRFTAYTQVGARGGVLDIDPSFGTFGGLFDAPGYTVTTLGTTVRVRREIEAFARVENLFDREYEEAFGSSLGRSAHIGVRIAAGR